MICPLQVVIGPKYCQIVHASLVGENATGNTCRSANALAGDLCTVWTHTAHPSIFSGVSEATNKGSLRRGCLGSPYKYFPISCWLLITRWIDAVSGVVLNLGPKTPPATLDARLFFVNASNEIVWYAARHSSTVIRNLPSMIAMRLRSSALTRSFVVVDHTYPPVLVPPIILNTCHGSIVPKPFFIFLWFTCFIICFNTNNAETPRTPPPSVKNLLDDSWIHYGACAYLCKERWRFYLTYP